MITWRDERLACRPAKYICFTPGGCLDVDRSSIIVIFLFCLRIKYAATYIIYIHIASSVRPRKEKYKHVLCSMYLYAPVCMVITHYSRLWINWVGYQSLSWLVNRENELFPLPVRA